MPLPSTVLSSYGKKGTVAWTAPPVLPAVGGKGVPVQEAEASFSLGTPEGVL